MNFAISTVILWHISSESCFRIWWQWFSRERSVLQFFIIMGHDNQWFFFIPIPFDHLFHQFLSCLKIQTRRNLIIKGQFRLLHHNHNDGKLLLLSARKRIVSFRQASFEFKEGNQLLQLFVLWLSHFEISESSDCVILPRQGGRERAAVDSDGQ